mgnify:CR=1 FL=1
MKLAASVTNNYLTEGEEYQVEKSDLVNCYEVLIGNKRMTMPRSDFVPLLTTAPDMPALTGGLSGYYTCHDVQSTQGYDEYTAICEDIIEHLEMTFAEGCAFKAIWRTAAARQGNGKLNQKAFYDAEKVEHYGKRMKVHAKLREEE